MAALAAFTVLAQDTTPAPSAAPAAPALAVSPASPTQPEAEAAPKPRAHRRRGASIKSRVALNPPATATVKAESVNVRGQPNFTGEVLGHLQKGETVTVLADIVLNHPPKDEPGQWSEIAMPTNIIVWVDGDYVDAETHAVKARRVNLRGGPGENYSVVGRLEKGTALTVTETKNGWMAIEPPTNAYAFVASDLLDLQPATAVASTAPAPAETPEVVNVPPAAVPAPATNEPAASTNETAAAPVAPAPTPQSEVDQELAALRSSSADAPAPTAVPAPAAPETAAAAPAAAPEPLPPRIVTREGFVHKAYNIQAPTDYELHDVATDRLIDYLDPSSAQKFQIYVGTRVTVTGPESLDQRWPRTPVLQVQSVQLTP